MGYENYSNKIEAENEKIFDVISEEQIDQYKEKLWKNNGIELSDYNVPIYWTTMLGGYGIMKIYEKTITKTESIYRLSRS